MYFKELDAYKPRKNFSKIQLVLDIPHLLEVQIKSYSDFLQMDISPEERRDIGLQRAFRNAFPIDDYNGRASLEFVSYRLDKTKYEPAECRMKGYTYVAPLYAIFRLVIWDTPPDRGEKTIGEKTIRDIKEQEVYFGEIPLMTPNGSFIVNGTERAIVNQLHRSPGVFFDQIKSKKDQSLGKTLYVARIVPQDGRWLDFEFDSKELLNVRIDRKKRFPVTVLLRALGYTERQIMQYFYPVETVYLDSDSDGFSKSVEPEVLGFQKATADVLNPETGAFIIKKGRKFVTAHIDRLKQAGIDRIPVDVSDVIGRVCAEDIVDENTGEVIVGFNEELTEEALTQVKSRGIKSIRLFFMDNIAVSESLRNTLLADKVKTLDEAITEIYRKFRPTDPPTPDVARGFLQSLFFNPDTYRLPEVGRIKINYKLNHGISDDVSTLTKEDIMETVKYLLNLKGGRGTTDDIDHLGIRRIRTVG